MLKRTLIIPAVIRPIIEGHFGYIVKQVRAGSLNTRRICHLGQGVIDILIAGHSAQIGHERENIDTPLKWVTG